jgi:hypothetical protein
VSTKYAIINTQSCHCSLMLQIPRSPTRSPKMAPKCYDLNLEVFKVTINITLPWHTISLHFKLVLANHMGESLGDFRSQLILIINMKKHHAENDLITKKMHGK